MAGGLARYVLNPVPLTVLLADKVVNAPVLAVDAPILTPLIAVTVEPKACGVAPKVIELLVKPELGILLTALTTPDVP